MRHFYQSCFSLLSFSWRLFGLCHTVMAFPCPPSTTYPAFVPHSLWSAAPKGQFPLSDGSVPHSSPPNTFRHSPCLAPQEVLNLRKLSAGGKKPLILSESHQEDNCPLPGNPNNSLHVVLSFSIHLKCSCHSYERRSKWLSISRAAQTAEKLWHLTLPQCVVHIASFCFKKWTLKNTQKGEMLHREFP